MTNNACIPYFPLKFQPFTAGLQTNSIRFYVLHGKSCFVVVVVFLSRRMALPGFIPILLWINLVNSGKHLTFRDDGTGQCERDQRHELQ